jgi:hypothetical protein
LRAKRSNPCCGYSCRSGLHRRFASRNDGMVVCPPAVGGREDFRKRVFVGRVSNPPSFQQPIPVLGCPRFGRVSCLRLHFP